MVDNNSNTENLGRINSQRVYVDGDPLSALDPINIYQFNITGNRDINLLLHNISNGDDADLRLFRDSNNNGVLDSGDRQVASSHRSGNANDVINYSATGGRYFAQVERYAAGSNGAVSYDLDLAAIYDAGTLSSQTVNRNRYSVDSSDPHDVFGFNITGDRDVSLLLHNISRGDDADLRLFQDSNNNGIFDSGDRQVASSRRGGTANDAINYRAAAGTYFAQVERYARGSNGAVLYDLDLTAEARQTRLTFDNIGFSVSNHSVWGRNHHNFEVQDDRFLGTSWNKKGSKSVAGFGIQGATSGRVGFQSAFSFDGGRLNASLPIDLWLDIPENIVAGETITIQSGFSLDNSASFSTTGLQASYDLDFIFDVNAKAGLRGFGRNVNLVNFDKEFSGNLLSLDGDSARFSLSENTLNGFGSFDVSLPQLDTRSRRAGNNSLTSRGSDDFLNASLDMDKVATSLARALALPVPDLEDRFNFGFGHVGYDLLDLELDAEIAARQAFDLQVDELTGQLVLENGRRIDFTVGEDVTFTVPDNIGDSLSINAVLDLDADFRNRSTLAYDVDASLEALSLDGRIGLNMPWPLPDIKKDFGLGPVVDKSYNILDGTIGLYNQTFELSGINQQTVSFEVPAVV